MRRALIAMLSLAALPVLAANDGGDSPRIGERLRRVFADRLRAEIAMTDEQAGVVLPKLEEVERARTKARREKLAIALDLRRGLRDGAADDELASLLSRFDAVDLRQEKEVRELLAEAEAPLTVRQRVELRFFLVRFKAEVERRLRGGADPGEERPRDRLRRRLESGR